jgi:predicted PurR-regulated permease PerM
MTTQWNTLTRAVVIGVGLVLIGWLLYVMWPLLTPLIIAALLAYVLNPLVKLVQKWTRLSRKWAVPVVYFSVLALMVTIPSALAPVAIKRLNSFFSGLMNVEVQLEALLAEPVRFAGQELHLGQMVSDLLNVTGESLASVAEGTRTVLEVTSASLLWLLVIMVSVYYLLLDGAKLRDWFVRLAPETAQSDVSRLLQEIDIIWRAYLRGTFVLMIIVGVVFTVVWLSIGLPGAIVLGALTGLLTVIPDIGPAIAALLAVLMAYFQGSNLLSISNFWFALLVFAIYFVLIQIKSVWLRPRVMKHFLHMNEGLIFVAIIGATVVWGILGALIIVPLLATVGVVGRYVRCRLLHLEPWPESVAPATLPDEVEPVDEHKPQLQPESDETLVIEGWRDGVSPASPGPILIRTRRRESS